MGSKKSPVVLSGLPRNGGQNRAVILTGCRKKMTLRDAFLGWFGLG
jgi:hypothetical protein